MSFRTEQRKTTFKKGIDVEDKRRNRMESVTAIRKNHREESLMKRRREGSASPAFEGSDPYSVANAPQLSQLSNYVIAANSSDPAQQHEACLKLRKLLSIENNPPIDSVIQSGVVPRLIQLLSSQESRIQLEAAWALTNIASGTPEQTAVVVDLGGIPAFIQLLISPHDEIKEQAVWAIGNMAGDGPKIRDLLLESNAMYGVMSLFTNNASLGLLRNGTWAMSNLCRGKPTPEYNKVAVCLPLLQQILLGMNDTEILTDACWAASYLSDGPNEKIKAVIDAGIPAHLVRLLAHSSRLVFTPALRAIGNLVTGDELQTQAVLDLHVLPALLNLLSNPSRGIKKETCWAISNITAGTSAQVGFVLQTNIPQTLIRLLENSEFEVRKEACWALSNACSGGKQAHVVHLVTLGVIPPLVSMLDASDPKTISVALEALDNILKVGEDVALKQGADNKFAEVVEEADGLEKLSELQKHENKAIYKAAVHIIERYWPNDEGEEENSAPNTSYGNVNAPLPRPVFQF